MKRVALLCALLMLMSLALTGCPGDNDVVVGGSYKDFKYETEAFKGKTLTIWQNWEQAESEALTYFEQQTGATLKFEMTPYTAYQDKVSGAILAGTGPDAFFMYQYTVPAWVKKGMIKPWNDILDLSAEPFAGKISQAVLDYYTMDGKNYGIYRKDGQNVFVVYYDKQQFSNAGLEDPYTLYNEGKWTWDKFLEMCDSLTYDSDDDGVTDKYAFDGYATESWLGSNGADPVKWVDGVPKFGLTEAAAIEALEMDRKVVETYRPPNPEGLPGETNFINGTVAMYFDGTYSVTTLVEKKGENLGVVPMPIGPKMDPSTKNLVQINAVPMGVASTCKEPELLAHYMEFLFFMEGNEDDLQKTIDDGYGGRRDLYETLLALKGEGFISGAESFGALFNLCRLKIYWNYADPPATLVQSYANQAQSIIDDVFYGE